MMKRVRVLHNFQLSLPWSIQFSSETRIDCSDASSPYFGFTCSPTQNTADQNIFVIKFYCENDNGEREEKQCLEWAKKPLIYERNTQGGIDSLILRTRIREGVFDFRKKKSQIGRIIITRYYQNTIVSEAFTDPFEIRVKTDKSVDHEALIPVYYPVAHQQSSGTQLALNNASSSHDEEEHNFYSEQPGSSASNNSDPFSMDEEYLILHFGNAEVMGNFRAINFYKASDRHIKQDIERIQSAKCRQTMLCIEGVRYRFKDSFVSTQQKFIGYIAQQVQQVVPEAVKCINGILHVDYEALIPYISESVRENYRDINNLEDDMEQVYYLIDQLYEQFQRLASQLPRSDSIKDVIEFPKKAKKARGWIVGLVVSIVVVMAVIASVLVYFFGTFNTRHTPLTSLTEATIPNVERDYLIEFFNATNGYNWKKNDSWLSSESICTWYGVVCDAENRTVFLSLTRNKLYGTIPAAINSLPHLQYLDLSMNTLFGVLPSTLTELKSLKSINLAANRLSSPIPTSIGQLQELEELNLASNQILGSLPDQIGQLSKLKVLGLSYNQLVNTIPISIGSLTALQFLTLDTNRLGGEIPASLGQLQNLTSLNLSNNGFNSGIPPVLFQMASLQTITIDNSQILGTLPDFGPMPNLVTLSLGGNQLTGTIPSSITNLPMLNVLNLASNRFYGTIPPFVLLSNIQEIYLQSNQFIGLLPQFPAAKLISLNVAFNQLSGTIPSFLNSATGLMWLFMQNNSFSAIDSSAQPKSLAQCKMQNNPFVCPVVEWIQTKCQATCQ